LGDPEKHHYYCPLRRPGKKRTLETIKKLSEGAKLQWKRLKSKGTVYKKNE